MSDELTEIVRKEEGRYSDELPKEQPKERLFWLAPLFLVGALWALLSTSYWEGHWRKSESSAKYDTGISQSISPSEKINYQPIYQPAPEYSSPDN